MSAFLIADVVSVDDPAGYDPYKPMVPPTLEAFDAAYLARSGPVTVLEGDWRSTRLVVVSFDSADAATQWWASPQYAQAKKLRQETTRTNMVVVEGV
jgi:uncharacterized protein (DUF1330 family)